MTIAFSVFPSDLRTPGTFVEVDPTRTRRGLAGQPHRLLLIVQRISSGSKPALALVRTSSKDDGKVFFGSGSLGHHMVERAKQANRFNEIWAIAVADNGAGVAAAGSITFSGPASGAGTLNLYIAGRRVQVAIQSAATASAIATAVNTAIGAAFGLPVTSAVNGSDPTKIDLTARHKGEIGNEIDLRFNYNDGEVFPAGVGATIVQLTSGSGNPDIAAAFAVIGDEWFNEIAMPWVDSANLATLEAELLERWGPTKQIDAQAFATKDGSVSTLSTFGNARNSQFVTVLPSMNSPTPAYEQTATLAAIVAAEAQRDPARPLTSLTLPNVLAPVVADRFTLEERNVLLHDGISTTTVGAGGAVQIERLITMWQVNAANVPDETLLDLNRMLTIARLRFTLRVRLASRFARSKLAADGTRFGAGQPVITPKIASGEVVALAGEWEREGWVQGLDQFKNDLRCEIDENDPTRLNILVPPDIIDPLLQTAVLLQPVG